MSAFPALLLAVLLAQTANGHVNGSDVAPVPRTTPGPSEANALRLGPTVPKAGSTNHECRSLSATIVGGRAAKQSVGVEIDTLDVTSHARITSNKVTYTPPSPISKGEHFAQVIGKDVHGVPFELKWNFTCETGPPTPLKTAPAQPR